VKGPGDDEIAKLAELTAIATVLVYPDTLAVISPHLSPDDVSSRGLGVIYAAILDMAARGEEVEPIALADKLRREGTLAEVGGLDAISDLMSYAEPPGLNFEQRTRIIRREARARRLRVQLQDAIDELDNGNDPEVAHSRLESGLVKLGAAYSDESEDDMAAITLELTAELERTGPRGVSWPWKDMDIAVGLLVPGRVWAVTAFSGGGKSTFLRSVALRLALAGTKTAYFAIEEKGQDVLGLMGCVLGGVSYTRYGQGFELTEKETELIVEGVTTLYNSKNLIVNTRKLWSPPQILARIRQYADAGVKVIIIDHAHLIQYPADSEEGVWHHIAQFAIHLNALAQQHDLVVLAAYQPRKPGDGGDIFRPVSPDEIRGPSDIWNIVYNTLSPYRPWVEVNNYGSTVLGADGLPKRVKPFSENGAPVLDRFYVEPGKQRVGGYGGRPVVLRFDPVSGRIYS
jgi:replicative DNA helicase